MLPRSELASSNFQATGNLILGNVAPRPHKLRLSYKDDGSNSARDPEPAGGSITAGARVEREGLPSRRPSAR
jgi:hypothetical protein